MNIGNQLYELRKKKNLSQEEVAEKLNVTRQTISKWETDQSMPDLDKIVPLCELYGISADALLKGTVDVKQREINSCETDGQLRKEKAKVISTSVFLYFLSIIWIIVSESLEGINENAQVGVFLLICAVATVYLIYKLMCMPKEGKEKEEKLNPYKTIDNIVSLLFTLLYFIVSFLTHAWGITWIIWLIYAVVIEIIHSIFKLKEDSHAE